MVLRHGLTTLAEHRLYSALQDETGQHIASRKRMDSELKERYGMIPGLVAIPTCAWRIV